MLPEPLEVGLANSRDRISKLRNGHEESILTVPQPLWATLLEYRTVHHLYEDDRFCDPSRLFFQLRSLGRVQNVGLLQPDSLPATWNEIPHSAFDLCKVRHHPDQERTIQLWILNHQQDSQWTRCGLCCLNCDKRIHLVGYYSLRLASAASVLKK